MLIFGCLTVFGPFFALGLFGLAAVMMYFQLDALFTHVEGHLGLNFSCLTPGHEAV